MVPLPHRPLDVDRYMARAGLELACLVGLARLARFRGHSRSQALAGLLLDQRVERALNQLAQVAARQRVAQELACFLELFTELSAGGKLHSQARGREWL